MTWLSLCEERSKIWPRMWWCSRIVSTYSRVGIKLGHKHCLLVLKKHAKTRLDNMLKKWKWTQNKDLLTTMLDTPFHINIYTKIVSNFWQKHEKTKILVFSLLASGWERNYYQFNFFASQWFFLNVWAHFKKVGKRCKYLSRDFWWGWNEHNW